jgi:hypothetical protein
MTTIQSFTTEIEIDGGLFAFEVDFEAEVYVEQDVNYREVIFFSFVVDNVFEYDENNQPKLIPYGSDRFWDILSDDVLGLLKEEAESICLDQ